jgi:hypothetical protein
MFHGPGKDIPRLFQVIAGIEQAINFVASLVHFSTL